MLNGITIANLNVQGIGDSRKRKDVFGYIRDKLTNKIPNSSFHFSEQSVIFGCSRFTVPENNILLLLCKHYIYKCKMKSVLPCLKAFKNQLLFLVKTEIINAQKCLGLKQCRMYEKNT
jgi:hypothetical protein